MSNVLRVLSAVALIGLGYALASLQGASSTPLPPDRAATLQRTPPRGEPNPQLVKALLEMDPLTRQRETIRVLQTIPPEDASSVLASLDRVAIGAGDIELGMIGTWMAVRDPEAGFRWAMAERNASHPWILSAVLRTWAAQDPAAATAAYYSIQNANMLGIALAAVVLGWDEGGHPGLPQFMHNFEQGQTPQIAIEALVQRKIVRDGPEATIRWAESLPEDDPRVLSRFKRNVLRRVAGALADWDPDLAMEWAASFGESKQYGRGAYRRVAIRTAARDGEKTMRWLQSLPAGPQREGAVQEGFRTWMIADYDGADAWIRAEPDAPWLDGAHAIFAQTLMVREGHEAALEWTGKVDQNLRRQRTAQKIGRAWFMKDTEAARAWVESAPDWASQETRDVIVAEKRKRPQQHRRDARAEQAAKARARALEAAEAASQGEVPEAPPEATPEG